MDIKEELKRIEEKQPDKKLVEFLFDDMAQMAKDISEKRTEIIIRLYLMQAIIENITLRQAFIKYKAKETISPNNTPSKYTCGNPTLIQKEEGKQLYNTYESYIKLVPRVVDNVEEIDWCVIESDFISFLTKGLEV